MSYSQQYRQLMASTSRKMRPIALVEMQHPAIDGVLRFTDCDCDVISNGENYTSIAMDIKMPSVNEKQVPAATLTISNLGGDVMRVIEKTAGAKNMQVTIKEVLLDAPNNIEREYFFILRNISATPTTITMNITYDDLLNSLHVPFLYDSTNHKGLV